MSGSISRSDLSAMIRSAQEKLASARYLLTGGFFSDVSSRSYYAVFHMLTALLATKGLCYSSHAQVLGAFNREFLHSAAVQGISFDQIQQLFAHRQRGDYGTPLDLTRESASQDIELAEQILDRCAAYLRDMNLLD